MTICARELIAILANVPDDTPIYTCGADVRIVWTDREGGISLEDSQSMDDIVDGSEFTILYEEN